MRRKAEPEPNFQQASQWWPDLQRIWTPLGWRDSAFRFNVLYNGMILAKPDLNRRTEAWAGQGMLLSILPGRFDIRAHGFENHYDGMARQGWCDGPAPVLWTEWSHEGLLYRMYASAHLLGGKAVDDGKEMPFAWLRLAIHDTCQALPMPEQVGFSLCVLKPLVEVKMANCDNLIQLAAPAEMAYPRTLDSSGEHYRRDWGYVLREPDRRVRLGIAPGQDCRVERLGGETGTTAFFVQMPAIRDAAVDLLLPMVPMPRTRFRRIIRSGRAEALRQSTTFWREELRCRTIFSVPEEPVDDAIRQSVRLCHMLTEKDPQSGEYCRVSGSWAYTDLWSVPLAMESVMFMDVLGYHRFVARYLEILKAEQGKAKPPGEVYENHPGYLSTPRRFHYHDWLSDNGAILYAMAMHGLLTGDEGYLADYTNAMIRSCEWIRDVRALRGHGGYEGVLPAARATDREPRTQALWSIGWNYKGLVSTVRLLEQLSHPRAAEFAREAQGYRQDFLLAFRHKLRSMPTWRDGKDCEHPFVPSSLHNEGPEESRDPFYLDAGPLFLVFSGLLPPEDPAMRSLLQWFRAGPQTGFFRRHAGGWQVPVLDHEISSCEPCYSWNVFFSLLTGDRQAYLEGMYSLFAGALSRQTRISCEIRNGVSGTVFAAALSVYMARLAVIDDESKVGELRLLRFLPLAWLRPGRKARFLHMPTVYGPVSLEVRLRGGTLHVQWHPHFRDPAPRVKLYLPPHPGLDGLVLNGERLPVDRRVLLISSHRAMGF